MKCIKIHIYIFHKLYSHIKLKIYIQKFYYDRFLIKYKIKNKDRIEIIFTQGARKNN